MKIFTNSKKRNEQRRELRKLDEQRSKKLATKFIFNVSSVTYRPPRGYYGNFGVGETRVYADVHVVNIDEDNDNNANQESDIMIVDDVSCRKKTNVLKKPKIGFLENQIIEDDKGDEGGGDKCDEGGTDKGDEGGADEGDEVDADEGDEGGADEGDEVDADEGDEGGADKGDKGGVVFSDDDSDRHDNTLDNNVQAALNQLDSSEIEADAIENYGNKDGQIGGQHDGSGKHYSDESDELVKRQRGMKGVMKNLPPNMPPTCTHGVVNEEFLEEKTNVRKVIMITLTTAKNPTAPDLATLIVCHHMIQPRIKISTLMTLMYLQLMLQLKSSGLGGGLQIQLKTVQDQVNIGKL